MKVILIATAAILIAISLLIQTATLFAFVSPLPSPELTQPAPPTYQPTDDEMSTSTPNPNLPGSDEPTPVNVTYQPTDPTPPTDKPTPIDVTRQPIDPTQPTDKPTLPIKETPEQDDDDSDDQEVQEERTWQSLLLPWKWFIAWQTVK